MAGPKAKSQKTGKSNQPGPAWKADTLEGLAKGSRVWFRAADDEWRLGTLTSVNPSVTTECIVSLDAGQGPGSGELVSTQIDRCMPANPAILDSVPDLTSLSFLNEPAILHDLRQRYGGDAIYTHAGPVLIAVNPFKAVPLYAADVVQRYKARSGTEQGDAWAPHVFLVADNAYKAMCQHGASQSLVISGESGAGKTETTKVAMQYLAGLAGGTGVEGAVLQTNPLLEAFGNARTLRNNNSSRFGKLIEIYFNKSRHICGALIQTYLLEKSRVVHQLPGERNYHIFYQLCKGVSSEEAERFCIPADALSSFDYLRRSGCTSIEGVDDAGEFVSVKRAMAAVGIAQEQQMQVFELLSGILWLGNVQFVAEGDDSVAVVQDEALSNAAALLQLPPAALVAALTRRTIMARSESIVTHLKLVAAQDARDALAKAAYAALFKWLVECINAALSVGKRKGETCLSILDIYGFECFKENSFEQLCINYANERLQQQFNKHLFKLEQEAYSSEGIDWRHVDFEDNQECLDLIESRPPRSVGILSLLDEECLFPKATDTTFGAKLRENLAKNGRFSWDTKRPGTDFTVEHYAGPVTYTCARFLDKNRDALGPDLAELLHASGQPLVQQLAGTVSAGQEKKGAQTVGSRFRDQLRDLIARLDQTELHFVRCIKPNSAQIADRFDAPLVLHQLRCCGVLEVTRIARAGYPTRYLHSAFAERYRVLLHSRKAHGKESALDVCRELLAEFRVAPVMYQVGKTKLFFRAGVLGHLEDTWARIQRSVLTVQSTWRMLRCRRAFLRHRRAAVRIQAAVRGRQQRGRYAQLLRRRRAATAVQAAVRGHQQRQRYQRVRWAVRTIQAGLRRYQVSQRVAVRVQARRAVEQRRLAAAEAQRLEDEQWDHIRAEYGLASNQQLRDVLSLWQQHGTEIQEWRQSKQQRAAQLQAQAEGHFVVEAAALPAQPSPSSSSADSPTRIAAVRPGQSAGWQPNPAASVGSSAEGLPGGLQRPQMRPAQEWEQLEAWEAYARQLEEQVQQLVAHNEELGREMAAVHSILDDGTDPDAHDIFEHARLGRHQGADGEGDDSQPEDPSGAPRQPGAPYLGSLAAELDRKQHLYHDDLAFITEVRQGAVQAPGMNPEQELRTLRMRFDAFRKDFKVRLADTENVLKRIDKEERKAAKAERRTSGNGLGRVSASSMASSLPEDKRHGMLSKLSFRSKRG